MKKDIRLNVLPVESTLRDVLSTLDRGVFGIVFIVDQVGRVVGIFTDGDVRRSLLRGALLDSGNPLRHLPGGAFGFHLLTDPESFPRNTTPLKEETP